MPQFCNTACANTEHSCPQLEGDSPELVMQRFLPASIRFRSCCCAGQQHSPESGQMGAKRKRLRRIDAVR